MMRNTHVFIFITFLLLVVLLGVPALYAGDASRIGTAAGTQVLIPVGGRDLGMGGSDLATTSGLDAIYWNPAGLIERRASGFGPRPTPMHRALPWFRNRAKSANCPGERNNWN